MVRKSTIFQCRVRPVLHVGNRYHSLVCQMHMKQCINSQTEMVSLLCFCYCKFCTEVLTKFSIPLILAMN